jgi:Restriction endonuclease BglII.
MKLGEKYDHLNALELILNRDGIYKEICTIINYEELIFGLTPPNTIKKNINERFNHLGWADKVKVGTSNLTISFLKSNIGVCFQLGNVARTYADILKLMQLHKKGKIKVGIICVPHKLESLKMGANYAQFERLSKDIIQFTDIVTVPILVIGLLN